MASSAQCPSCGRRYPEGYVRCPHDGEWLPEPTPGAPPPDVDVTVRRADPLIPRSALGHKAAEALEPTQLRPPTGRSGEAHPAEKQGDPLVGQPLGEFVVGERIGVGGMGLVYRGEQPLIGKKVAIKVLRPDVMAKQHHMQRLLAEARAVNAIGHRGIIDIFSFGQTPDGRQYFVMEFLEGAPLDRYIQERGALPVREALGLGDEILDALIAAHQAGVVHRDVKPNNIFRVTPPSGSPYVKVLDFGLAKVGPEAAKAQTVDGIIFGTPEYMAPEQICAEPVTPKTDLYAFGVVAYQMLTGKLPFGARNTQELMVQHLEKPPTPPRIHRADLPDEVADWVMALLEKEPGARPDGVKAQATLRKLLRALPRDGQARARKPTGRAPRTETVAEVPSAASGAKAPRTPSVSAQADPPEAERGTPAWLGVSVALGLATAGVTVLVLGMGLLEKPPPLPPDFGKATPIALPGASAPPPSAAEAHLPPAADARPQAVPDKEEPAHGKARGTLTLLTSPESEVSSAGVRLGRTPLFNVPLAAGTHLLRLKGPDGTVHLLSVPIKATEKNAYRFRLDELPTEKR